jgi:hypothetical protein
MLRYRLLPLFALATSLLAQRPVELFSKAPPDIDDALRARVTTFYQAHVDGKPRRAEELVAEDTKDYFYNARKPQYISFQIIKIDYTDTFTKATVTTMVETIIAALGFTDKPIKVPLPSFWKFENGQWWWYIDAEKLNTAPFGTAKFGVAPGTSTSPNSTLPNGGKGPDVAAVVNQVRADKTAVAFKAGVASTEQITIVNSMPGAVSLVLADKPIPFLDFSLSASQLKGGEKATLSIRYAPGADASRKSQMVRVEIKPLGRFIPIRIQIQ